MFVDENGAKRVKKHLKCDFWSFVFCYSFNTRSIDKVQSVYCHEEEDLNFLSASQAMTGVVWNVCAKRSRSLCILLVCEKQSKAEHLVSRRRKSSFSLSIVCHEMKSMKCLPSAEEDFVLLFHYSIHSASWGCDMHVTLFQHAMHPFISKRDLYSVREEASIFSAHMKSIAFWGLLSFKIS